MSQMYDFIDHKDFLKKRSKKNALMITEFDKLIQERDQFYLRLFIRAYHIAEGNIAAMARGLKYSRNTLHNYLVKAYGDNYKQVLDDFVKNIKVELS
jgi:DNA-binding NtrC family response regulator